MNLLFTFPDFCRSIPTKPSKNEDAVLLTALVVAASLDTTTADEEIPWITEVLMREAIPFDEDKTAVEMKVSWSDAIASNK